MITAISELGRIWSGGPGGQGDERIIAKRCGAFQRHVEGALEGPLVELLEQDGTDEGSERGWLGKMPTTSVRRLIAPLR